MIGWTATSSSNSLSPSTPANGRTVAAVEGEIQQGRELVLDTQLTE
jgi:hypothetical protein